MSSMCAEEPGPLRYLDNGLLDVTPTEEYVAITEINAQVSPLLQLPAELRDQIWHCVLKDHTIRPLPNRLQNLLHNYELAMKEKFKGFKRLSEHHFSLLLVPVRSTPKQEGFGSLEKINVQLMPRTWSEIVFSLDTETMEWAKAHEIELNMSTCTFEEMMNRWLAGLE
ncbi:hypothetical protein HBH92_172770 [Parastagonospora nodorum]|nr:hypothetical protein HBH92_172770 [Parastagonospora nodorum]KAH4447764.1 hypothetical protein HBH93_052220 [Parastagonospora nodorum]KAH4460060.1 hypothetical protein HBH91_071340 [Parastagonospora nodorum]KAH4497078.1 hypothetical protein HBH89_139510 [Parastagonospora nodorum]KAH4535278.1 hypothetical protein HBH85_162860 [Parastagonospora nodorum]